MGNLLDDLTNEVSQIFADKWTTSVGQKVPEAADVSLGNEAVELTGTVLYADLSDSTDLVRTKKHFFAAEVYKSYLHCASKIIRACGGVITSYDGDRVMAVFIDGNTDIDAARCGRKIHWATINIIQPSLKAQYPNSSFKLQQTVGIDTSDFWVARTGIRGSNDLVWIGNAANYAAKMASLGPEYPTRISKAVFDMLDEKSKIFGDPKKYIWTNLGDSQLGIPIYGSTIMSSI
jgi:class 3 adenylate cyclase